MDAQRETDWHTCKDTKDQSSSSLVGTRSEPGLHVWQNSIVSRWIVFLGLLLLRQCTSAVIGDCFWLHFSGLRVCEFSKVLWISWIQSKTVHSSKKPLTRKTVCTGIVSLSMHVPQRSSAGNKNVVRSSFSVFLIGLVFLDLRSRH